MTGLWASSAGLDSRANALPVNNGQSRVPPRWRVGGDQ
jgi:hypothetical protein